MVPKEEEDNAQKLNTDSLNKSPNNERIGRTDDREDWKAMIADVCNRPGTC